MTLGDTSLYREFADWARMVGCVENNDYIDFLIELSIAMINRELKGMEDMNG